MQSETRPANARIVVMDLIAFVALAASIALATAIVLVAAVLLLAGRTHAAETQHGALLLKSLDCTAAPSAPRCRRLT